MTASQQATPFVQPNTAVTYHGSKVSLHGPATVVQRCLCQHCPRIERGELGNGDVRYELEFGPGECLLHVRRESFTVVPVSGTCAWCEQVHDDPVTVDPFTLGALVRSMGAAAFEADCATVARRARGEQR